MTFLALENSMDHERAIHFSYVRRNGYCAKAMSAYRSLGDLIGANYWWYRCQRRTNLEGVRHCDIMPTLLLS